MKLTDEQVRQFRTRCVINEEYVHDLCVEFGISMSHGWRIATGEYRAKAGGPLYEGRRRPRRDHPLPEHMQQTMTDEDKTLIRKLVADGATHKAVAGVMFCSRSLVTKIVNEGKK